MKTPRLARALLGLSLLSTLGAGCAPHPYRVYDPYYRDYHDWDHEGGFYQRWETETHRDHREFRDRHEDEQKEYWSWRHSHSDDHH
jgi:hypothetical protein